MKEVYILESIRSARASTEKEGALTSTKPIDIILPLFKNIIQSYHLPKDAIDELLIGCASQLELQGPHLATAIRILSGLSPACQTSMISSGRATSMNSLQIAFAKISANQSQLCLVGALHSSTGEPHYHDNNLLINDPSLYRKINYIPLHLAADCLATIKGFTRRDLDQFAYDSHKKASDAYLQGKFKRSLITLRNSLDQSLSSYDELVSESISMEDLAKYKPFFENELSTTYNKAFKEFKFLNGINYLHHNGNSAASADASSVVLLGSKEASKEYGLSSRAKIRSIAFSTQSTIENEEEAFTAQMNATQEALQRANLNINDIELFEVDESFAALPLNFIDQFRLDPSKINVNGGPIATGEAYGTGAQFMLISLLDELERRGQRIGLISQYSEYDQVYCMIIELNGDSL